MLLSIRAIYSSVIAQFQFGSDMACLWDLEIGDTIEVVVLVFRLNWVLGLEMLSHRRVVMGWRECVGGVAGG